MVKWKITKDEFDALSPELQGEYKVDGEGYKLDVTGIDVKANEKVDAERDKRRAAEKKAKDAEDALDAFKEGDDRPSLVANHEKALKKEKDAREAAEKKYTDKVRKDALGNTANTLATALSATNAKVLLPHINGRLDVDMTDPDNPKVVVLDADGKKTDKTVDDLKAEFVANKDFSGIITGSKATGGAASKSVDTGGSGHPSRPGFTPPTGNTPNLANASSADLVKHIEARRAARGQEVAG